MSAPKIMDRREFLQKLGAGAVCGLGLSRLAQPLDLLAESSAPRLALLADAHLPDGNPAHATARALARAVAEIKALCPPPDLALFAGDLAHDGDPRALALGREILSDLPVPLLAVPGEGDGDGGEWRRLFGDAPFSRTFQGCHFLGLRTDWAQTPYGPGFTLSEFHLHHLQTELARLDPDTPLVILSHAPLSPLFRPWGQWTMNAPTLLPQLTRFRRVLCLYGHVHGIAPSPQLSAFREPCGSGDGIVSHHFTDKRTPQNLNPLAHQALPATSWPLPSPLQGTPAILEPGLGPCGCGWSLLTFSRSAWKILPHLWQA